jgi:two-component system, NarL family, nitrate/nitrite response regulator NarL
VIGPESSIRVLVVDDNPQFADVLTAILAGEEGLSVIGSALDGQEAIDLTEELEPDVVLMDISMPVIDGFEATRRIVAAHPETRVIMLTGSSTQEDRAQAREAGAVGYVVKDRALDELGEAIRTATDRRGLS